MNEEDVLIEQREELKKQLAAGEYDPKLWQWVDQVGHLMQRLFRLEKRPSYGVNTAVLTTLLLLIGMLISLLLGEFQNEARQAYIPLELLGALFLFTILILNKAVFTVIFSAQREYLLDDITSTTNLWHTRKWLKSLCSKSVLLFGILYSVVIIGIFLFRIAVPEFGFVSLGVTFEASIIFFVAGMGVNYLILILMWVSSLGQYHLKLYTADPSNSEIISRLSIMMRRILYLFVVIGLTPAIFIPFWGALTLLESIVMIATLWVAAIAFFVMGQISLSTIISNAKWRELNRLQARIEKLSGGGNIEEKETMETIKRLTEYHNQILQTHNSAMNIRAGLNFVTSLLLPILAFVLTNLDTVLAFFK